MFATIFNYRISMQLYQKKIFIMIFVIFYDKVYLEKIILIFVIKYEDIKVFFFFFIIQKTPRFLLQKAFLSYFSLV